MTTSLRLGASLARQLGASMTIWWAALARRSNAELPKMGPSKKASHSSTPRLGAIRWNQKSTELSTSVFHRPVGGSASFSGCLPIFVPGVRVKVRAQWEHQLQESTEIALRMATTRPHHFTELQDVGGIYEIS